MHRILLRAQVERVGLHCLLSADKKSFVWVAPRQVVSGSFLEPDPELYVILCHRSGFMSSAVLKFLLVSYYV